MTLSVAASLEDQLTRAAAEFKKLYGRPAKFAAVAPGRFVRLTQALDRVLASYKTYASSRKAI